MVIDINEVITENPKKISSSEKRFFPNGTPEWVFKYRKRLQDNDIEWFQSDKEDQRRCFMNQVVVSD